MEKAGEIPEKKDILKNPEEQRQDKENADTVLPEGTKRKRNGTEQGELYQIDMLANLFKNNKTAVVKQVNILHKLVEGPNKIGLLLAENESLDRKFEALLETLGRLRERDITEEQKQKFSNDIADVDARLYNIKQKIKDFQEQNQESQNLFSNQFPKVEGMPIKYREQLPSSTRKSSSVSSSRKSTSSSLRQKATILGLEAKKEAMLRTQKAETEYETLQAEAEAKAAKQIKEVEQRLQLLKIEGELEKAKAIQNVYDQEENKARSVASSNVSRASRSSIVQRVKIAGLEAEKTTRLRIQEAELEIEKIKEQHTIDLAKKLKNAKHKIDLLKLDEQLQKSLLSASWIIILKLLLTNTPKTNSSTLFTHLKITQSKLEEAEKSIHYHMDPLIAPTCQLQFLRRLRTR